ncbi:MAG: hypothetical protein NUW37_13570 [Planctomycetes bacterium]|nr:hypothetical protein [Planctomycetota bacterium]
METNFEDFQLRRAPGRSISNFGVLLVLLFVSLFASMLFVFCALPFERKTRDVSDGKPSVETPRENSIVIDKEATLAESRAGWSAFQTDCAARLNALGKAAIMYQTRMRYFPRASGAHFFKTLYAGEMRYVTSAELLICPESGDDADDVLANWTAGDNSAPPGMSECSYAGPNQATGAIRMGFAMGSDDHEPEVYENPAMNQNHQARGVNVLWPDASTQWIDNPPGKVCRIGYSDGKAALVSLQN